MTNPKYIKYAGYVFLGAGLLLFISSFFLKSAITPETPTSKEFLAFSKIEIFQGGLTLFALGLIIISVNRN